MKYLLVGLGNIGSKRRAVLGDRCVATVDPYNPKADHKKPAECDASRYDAAILSVPNDVKVELLRFFLDRGKHVLVEKPLMLDDRTADDLGARATRSGAIWYTSYNFRFEPNVVAIKQQLEEGTLGRIYRVRMFYGNGTARDHVGTWRDSRFGVIEDMGSHLLDLAGFVFGRAGRPFETWDRRGYELNGIDHAVLASDDHDLVIECSFLSWKNRWQIEIVGEKGALRMDGLTKWGTSELVHHVRTLPSGAPQERLVVARGPDPTWASDIAHFEEMARSGATSRANDVWLTKTVEAAATSPLRGART